MAIDLEFAEVIRPFEELKTEISVFYPTLTARLHHIPNPITKHC